MHIRLVVTMQEVLLQQALDSHVPALSLPELACEVAQAHGLVRDHPYMVEQSLHQYVMIFTQDITHPGECTT